MKFATIVISLLCLIIFSNEGIINVQNNQLKSDQDGLSHFEASPSNASWDFENSHNHVFGSSENTASSKRRRGLESNDKGSNIVQKLYHSFPDLHSITGSKINLFLIFHFSLSLWQVFLQ